MNYQPLIVRDNCYELSKKDGAINFVVKNQKFEQDPVSYLTQFGDIYIGNLKSEIFTKIFYAEKSRYLYELFNVDKCEPIHLQPAAFKTMLCRESMIHHWRWPAIVNQLKEYSFYSGLGRLLATGMTKSEPWKHLKILLFANKNNTPDEYLENFSLVTTSQQLHSSLHIGYNSSNESQLELEIQHNGTGPGGFVITTMYDGNTDFNYNAGDEFLANFAAWKNLYSGTKPKLYVYTDWPELIVDSLHFWDVEIAGPRQYTHTTLHLGHLEFSLREQNSSPAHNDNHVLYVNTDIQIDISDLITWVDLKHTAWIDQQLQFILFRHNNPYKMMFVSKSYV